MVIDLVCSGVSLAIHAREAGDDVAALRQSVVAADHLSSMQSLAIKSMVVFIMPFIAAGMVAVSASANFIETAIAPVQSPPLGGGAALSFLQPLSAEATTAANKIDFIFISKRECCRFQGCLQGYRWRFDFVVELACICAKVCHTVAMPPRVLILPGYGNSGPQHWQSRWEATHPHFVRVQQRDWDYPVCAAWVATLDAAVCDAGDGVVLVAHSLGCLTVAHWAASASAAALARVTSALLVAPPDPSRSDFPPQIQGFDHVPQRALPFRSTVVISSNDPYDPLQQGAYFAQQWGSNVVRLDGVGHINSDSGLGDWPVGMALLTTL